MYPDWLYRVNEGCAHAVFFGKQITQPTPEDDVRGAPLVAIISYDVWTRRFGANPVAIGRTRFKCVIVLTGGHAALILASVSVGRSSHVTSQESQMDAIFFKEKNFRGDHKHGFASVSETPIQDGFDDQIPSVAILDAGVWKLTALPRVVTDGNTLYLGRQPGGIFGAGYRDLGQLAWDNQISTFERLSALPPVSARTVMQTISLVTRFCSNS